MPSFNKSPENFQSPLMLNDFLKFWKKSKNPFAGLNQIKNSDTSIRSLLSKKVTSKFIAFAEHDTESLVAFWLHDGTTSPENAPIVWLDSEGSPNGVFANTTQDFLTILPYGTGLIYEFLYCWEDYIRDPQETPHPKEELDAERINSFLEETKEEFSGWKNLVDWLDSVNIDWKSVNPFQIMEKAFTAHPNLDEWLEKNV